MLLKLMVNCLTIISLSSTILAEEYILADIKGTINFYDVSMPARSRLHCATKCLELDCVAYSLGQDLVCRITSKQKVLEQRHKVIEDEVTSLYLRKDIPRNCSEVDGTKEVILFSPTGGLDRVYCTKKFAGKSAMIFHPTTWNLMATADINAYNYNSTEVLFFLGKTNGEQRWGLLRQLTSFRNKDLEIRRNSADSLVVSFIPWLQIWSGIAHGLEVNGAEVAFTQCPVLLQKSSEIAFSISEASMMSLSGSDQQFLGSSQLATSFYSQMTPITKSAFLIPETYFTFTNIVFGKRGSCGINAFAGLDGIMQGGSLGVFEQ